MKLRNKKGFAKTATFAAPERNVFFLTKLDVPEDVRNEVNSCLNQLLADVIDLRLQFRVAHWNIKGLNSFYYLHLMFDEIQGTIDDYADTLAETITTFGGIAFGRCQDVSTKSRLPEFPILTDEVEESPSGVQLQYLNALDEAVVMVAAYAREKVNYIEDELKDKVTSNMLQEIVAGLQKIVYFIEAHLQRG